MSRTRESWLLTQDRLRRLEGDARVLRLPGGGGSGSTTSKLFTCTGLDQVTKSATISGGFILIQSGVKIDVPGATVNVAGGTSGNPVWVYIKMQITDPTVVEIPAVAVNPMPTPDDKFIQWPLCSFYEDKGVVHKGDVAWDGFVPLLAIAL